MNRIEQIAVAAAALLLASFFYAVWLSRDAGVRLPEPCAFTVETFGPARVETNAAGRVQVFAKARMWNFEPANIEVPVGKPVDFYLLSEDVVHGMQVHVANLNLMAVYGAPNFVSGVVFNKAGTFDIICNEYCGTMHQVMAAKIVVR